AKNVWKNVKNGTGKFFSYVGKGLKNAASDANNALGAFFGMHDKDGKPVSFTTGVAGKVKDAAKAISKFATNTWKGAKNLWNNVEGKTVSAFKTFCKGLKN